MVIFWWDFHPFLAQSPSQNMAYNTCIQTTLYAMFQPKIWKFWYQIGIYLIKLWHTILKMHYRVTNLGEKRRTLLFLGRKSNASIVCNFFAYRGGVLADKSQPEPRREGRLYKGLSLSPTFCTILTLGFIWSNENTKAWALVTLHPAFRAISQAEFWI